MNRLIISLVSLLTFFAASSQLNLGDLLNNIGKNEGKGNDIAGAISGIVGGVLSNDKIQLSDMVGKWSYSSPAVYFKSDDLLKKAGGAAAATAVEKKLEPYYKRTGLNTVKLTVENDSSFIMNVRSVNLTGNLSFETEENNKSNVVFHFQALKKVNIGSMNAYVVKNADGSIDLMFDISKLITLADKISTLLKNNTVSSAIGILKGYDGLCSGFKLTKE